MILNMSGGGGTGLNFKVVGNPQPSNPNGNTIWVNTDTAITSWIFSATKPSNAEAGMVWFSVGTSSPVAFNALKKNGIQVYPIFAKQYVNGVWADKTAKSYQGGKWVDWWRGEIFKDGVQFYEFEAIKWKNHNIIASINVSGGQIDFVHGNQNNYSLVQTKKKINLSEWSTLTFNVTSMLNTNGRIHFGVTSTSGASESNWAAVTTLGPISTEKAQTVALDISSLSGEYYIVVGFAHWDWSDITHVTCSSIIMS